MWRGGMMHRKFTSAISSWPDGSLRFTLGSLSSPVENQENLSICPRHRLAFRCPSLEMTHEPGCCPTNDCACFITFQIPDRSMFTHNW